MKLSATMWGPACALLLALAGAAVALPGQGAAKDELDPAIKTGIEGLCQVQYLPGIPNAKAPPPRPLAGQRVQVTPVGEKKVVAEARTNAAGRFRVAVPPGRYRVALAASKVPAVRPAPQEVTVPEGKLARVQFRLVVALP